MSKGSAVTVALAAALMLAVAVGIGRFAFTPLLPMMQKDLGLSLALGGWLATANYAGYLVGALSATRLRLGPSRIVPLSLLATALFTAAMAWTHAPAAWVALRFLAGVVSAWVLIFTSTWALHRLAAHAAPGLRGVLFAGIGLGIVITGLLCMGFLRMGWSSDRSWFALGTVALFISLCAVPVMGGGYPEERPAVTPAAPAAGRSVMALALTYGIFGFGYIIPATFLPAMAKQRIADP